MSILCGVPRWALDRYWPPAEAAIARAVARSDGRYAVADVLAALRAGDMQLWVSLAEIDDGASAVEAACITEIVSYPREKRCGIVFCAGKERKNWLHQLAGIETWAKALGCTAMELQGRPGWERILPDWRKTHVILRKRI
ncbi:MAG TPA: hypothetical protein VJJ77_08910 [Dongiaceae bacterium]|nr:hypothetical protein [Dongiaceae bacterium]